MKTAISFIFLVSFLYSTTGYAGYAKIIKIGTGNKNALAYPIMSDVCNTFNSYNLEKNIPCLVFQTGGSEDNLNGIINQEYDAGVIKADMAYNVYNGIGIFSGKAFRALRTIFGLHNEYLTIIVKNNSGINSLKGLYKQKDLRR